MNKHPIPPITDPLGKFWNQPDLKLILIDDTHALMEMATFEGLADYSCTMPSGVYPGKMWRCRVKYDDESMGWLLRWYGESEKPGYVSNHHRRIILA